MQKCIFWGVMGPRALNAGVELAILVIKGNHKILCDVGAFGDFLTIQAQTRTLDQRGCKQKSSAEKVEKRHIKVVSTVFPWQSTKWGFKFGLSSTIFAFLGSKNRPSRAPNAVPDFTLSLIYFFYKLEKGSAGDERGPCVASTTRFI